MYIKGISIILAITWILGGCTTMPKVSEKNTGESSNHMIEYAEKNFECREMAGKKKLAITSCDPTLLGANYLYGNFFEFGAALLGASLAEKRYVHSALGKMLIGKPSRVYKKLQAKRIFEKLSKVLSESGFDLVTIDKSSGILFGVLDKGIIKSFLLWEWKQNQYATFVLIPVLDNKLETRLHYLFWVEEKPPLSSDYVEVKTDLEGREMMRGILETMDKYVLEEGGEL